MLQAASRQVPADASACCRFIVYYQPMPRLPFSWLPPLAPALFSCCAGEARVDLSRHAPYIRAEWDALREHDAVFLITIRYPVPHDADPATWWAEEQARRAASAEAAAAAAASADGAALADEDHGAGGSRLQLDDAPAAAAAAAASAAPAHAQPPHQQQQHQQQRGGQQRGSGGGGGGGGGRRGAVPDEDDPTFPARMGVVAVRGGEVVEVRDERGDVFNDPHAKPEDRGRKPAGYGRTYKLALDPAQYHADMLTAASGKAGGGDAPDAGVYGTFNLLVRRRGEANNFKAVLATIRDGA
jgi:hypothetical protein